RRGRRRSGPAAAGTAGRTHGVGERTLRRAELGGSRPDYQHRRRGWFHARRLQRGARRARSIGAHVLDERAAWQLLRPRPCVERLRLERAIERGRRRRAVNYSIFYALMLKIEQRLLHNSRARARPPPRAKLRRTLRGAE